MPAKSRCDKRNLPTIGHGVLNSRKIQSDSIPFDVGQQARTGGFDEVKLDRKSVFQWRRQLQGTVSAGPSSTTGTESIPHLVPNTEFFFADAD
jgi:hypothetical protein